MPSTVLVDTGFLVALFRGDDPYHPSALALMAGRLRHERSRLVTVWPVIVETCFFFRPQDRPKFIRWIEGGALILRTIEPSDLNDIAAIFDRYGDRDMDLADACLVWLAGREKTNRVLTTDRRDFDIYRTPDGKPFERLSVDDRA